MGVEDIVAQCGVTMKETLVPGMESWFKFYQYWFDGECYEYAFTAGSNLQTPQQADDSAARAGVRRMAQTRFLEEVRLETMQ